MDHAETCCDSPVNGFGAIALSSMLADEGLLAGETNPMFPRAGHHTARAKNVIQVFLSGGVSHVDTFDPKPMLAKYHGKMLPTRNLRTENENRCCLRLAI